LTKVLVTGGAGRIGRATTERLLQHGYDVRVLDLHSNDALPGAEYVIGDLNDYERLREQIRGCDSIIHLAAIAAPSLAPGYEVFRVNVAGTFNVFEAAAAEGVRRVVQASSINAIGCAWSVHDIAPQYFPIDEDHPRLTDDPYSLSKAMVEDLGAYYWRRDGIASVGMRFPWVYPGGYAQSDEYRRKMEVGRSLMDELCALSEAERQARLADARVSALDYRARRSLEFPVKEARPSFYDDPLWYAYAFDRFNFWAFVDVRDAAQSLEKALTADFEGSHALFISDHHNWLGYDTRTIAGLFFPETSLRESLSGSQAMLSIEKARTLIGFEPEYSVHGGNHANR
jgi:nucleoside-diphosphate-sugar epimerase